MLPGVGCDERLLHPTMGDLGTLGHTPEGARAAVEAAGRPCPHPAHGRRSWSKAVCVLCLQNPPPPAALVGVNLPLSVSHRESHAPCSQLGPCSLLRVPKGESGPLSWVPPGKLRHAGGMQRQRGE